MGSVVPKGPIGRPEGVAGGLVIGTFPGANVATNGGVRSKMIEGLVMRFFELGGYKIELLLTKW